jgi:hypothetical protein
MYSYLIAKNDVDEVQFVKFHFKYDFARRSSQSKEEDYVKKCLFSFIID